MDGAPKHTFVLILAGGGGTRLWPISRENHPKQFLKLFSDRSLYEMSVDRALKLVPHERIFVATNIKYVDQIKQLSPQIPPENIISEPIRRDSTLPRGIACLLALKKDPQAVIINIPCDHLIVPLSKYLQKIKLAVQVATTSPNLVVVGVEPTYPHVGMGYIKASRTHPSFNCPDILVGEKYIEKPDLKLAQKFIQTGNYYWNANYFVWQANVYLDLLKKYSPKTYAFLPQLSQHLGTSREKEILQSAFQMSPTVAVEYAVLEKLKSFPLVKGDFRFTDVGDWKEVWNSLDQDQQGNVIKGSGESVHIGIDSENNMLILNKKLIATVGLRNTIVIDTPDAMLICPKDSAQAVKKTVEALKQQGLTQYL